MKCLLIEFNAQHILTLKLYKVPFQKLQVSQASEIRSSQNYQASYVGFVLVMSLCCFNSICKFLMLE